MAEEKPGVAAVTSVRSVGYPYLKLEDAVGLAKKLWESVGKNAVPVATAGKAWGYSEKSSGLRSGVAALKQYGLIENAGWGDSRTIKLSERALDIVLEPEGSPKRALAIQEAAKAPSIYSDIMVRFPSGIPASDHAIAAYLLREKNFNRNSVDSFIEDFRANWQYAKLNDPVTIPSKAAPPAKEIAVGDLIQWESSGALKLPAPTRVRAIKDHEGAQWVFIEGSETGMPMAEVLLEKKGDGQTPLPPTMPVDVFKPTMSHGEKEWLRGQLSKDTNYRLFVSGEIGPKEIGRLIKILTAQQEVLADDAEND